VAREADAPVLELACGTGRLTHALAEAGIAVVGLDNDPVMLAAATAPAAAPAAATHPNRDWPNPERPNRDWPIFVAGDMRHFALDRRFGLVFVGYNSLQLLTDPHDMTACLRHAREHLAPGGRVGVEVTDFQVGGADGPGNAPELLGEAEGIRLAGSLVHDLEARTSCYRRHFEGDGWAVDNEIVVRSIDRRELEDLFGQAGLTGERWWSEGATIRALACQ
jgi:SAM-dependent methyltransferase